MNMKEAVPIVERPAFIKFPLAERGTIVARAREMAAHYREYGHGKTRKGDRLRLGREIGR